MTSPASTAPPLPVGERVLARSVSVTWWYTVSGIVFFAMVTHLQWTLWILAEPGDAEPSWRVVATLAAAVLGSGGAGVLLRGYRPRSAPAPEGESRRVSTNDLTGFGAVALAAVLLGTATGSLLAAGGVIASAFSVRAWRPGVRWRVILVLTLALVGLWVFDAGPLGVVGGSGDLLPVPAVFALILPVMCASSLWWWDIVLELDRARAAESMLAATRERLRLANDVHDLQGHHLQVIALQLELAQRLMRRDPEAAAIEIGRARASVDDARQGTRDLAARFRGAPLGDELGNATDLLRSAGLEVSARVDADVDHAPADVLGPIVRESVTNVLKHGGGLRAELSLARHGDFWVYRLANDDAHPSETGPGSGLKGMTERVKAVGGEVHVQRRSSTFEVRVSVPVTSAAAGLAITEGGR